MREAVDSNAPREHGARIIAHLSQIELQLRDSYPAANLASQRDFDSITQAKAAFASLQRPDLV